MKRTIKQRKLQSFYDGLRRDGYMHTWTVQEVLDQFKLGKPKRRKPQYRMRHKEGWQPAPKYTEADYEEMRRQVVQGLREDAIDDFPGGLPEIRATVDDLINCARSKGFDPIEIWNTILKYSKVRTTNEQNA